MVAQKFRFAILQIEVTHASRGLSAIAELLVFIYEHKIELECKISKSKVI